MSKMCFKQRFLRGCSKAFRDVNLSMDSPEQRNEEGNDQ